MSILVFGSTGNNGRAVVQQLLQQGADFTAAITHPDRAKLLPKGAKHIVCRFDEPTSIIEALASHSKVFLLVPFHEQMVAWGKRVIEQAKSANIQQIIRITAWDAALDSASKMSQLHSQIDTSLVDSGINYTILRCNSFMQNFTHLYGAMIKQKKGFYLAEGNAKSAFVSTDDIGEAVANLLLENVRRDRMILDITGQELLSNIDVAQIISDELGATILYHSIDPTVVNKGYRAQGLSEWKIEVLGSLTNYINSGHAARICPELMHLLGRTPTSFRSFAHQYKQC